MTPAATAAPQRTLPRRPSHAAPPRRRAVRPETAPRQQTSRPRSTFAEQIGALPDSKLLVRLTRGRIWIALIGVMLLGLVFMQVSLLQLNTGISNADQSISTLERANQQARTKVASMSSVDRIQRLAAQDGMVLPTQSRYLRAGAGSAATAASNVTAPNPVKQLADWQLATAGSGGVTGVATAAAQQNAAPAAQTQTQTQATAPAATTSTPAVTPAPAATTTTTTQAAAAPQVQQPAATPQVQQPAAATTATASTGGATPAG